MGKLLENLARRDAVRALARCLIDVDEIRKDELVSAAAGAILEARRGALEGDVIGRLAGLILDLPFDESNTCNHKGGAYDFLVPQYELADAVGASRSYVSTVINDWKREGILRGYGRVTCVVKPGALRKLARRREAA
jgi:CRP-like cAMP-binding protein